MAKSTFCRKCSDYFAITPAVLAGTVVAPANPPPSPRTQASATWTPAPDTREPARTGSYSPVSSLPPAPVAAGGFREKFSGLLGSKPKTRTAHCFECTSWHEISTSAQSTTCKACGAYIDLQDYKINGGFSRNIKTRGTLYLGSKGDLSSSKILCEQATIHGKMRGNLTCAGKVTVRVQGRLYGSLEAGQLIVEKGSEVIFSRPVHASGVEVHGAMTGQIVSDSHVTIFKSGSLDGAVDATGFTVERGGCFQGELTIRPRGTTETATEGDDANKATETISEAAAPRAELLGGEQQPALG